MALRSWPDVARIVRLDMGIIAPQTAADSPLSGRQMRGARYAEIWTGRVAIAAMTQDGTHEFSAFVESLRGRSGQFEMPLEAGFASRAGIGPGLVVTAAAAGESIVVDFVNTGETLTAGTLLQIGTTNEPYSQIVECIEDVATSASTTVKIAPRLRTAYPADTLVYTGSVVGRFRLTADDSGAAQIGVGYGDATIAFYEAPYVDSLVLDGLQDDNAADYLLDDDGAQILYDEV